MASAEKRLSVASFGIDTEDDTFYSEQHAWLSVLIPELPPMSGSRARTLPPRAR